MHSIQIVILLVVNVALRNINEVSSASNGSPPLTLDIQIPEGKTVEQYVQQMTDFWTDQRLSKAIPKPLPTIDSLSTDEKSSDATTSSRNEEPTLVQGTAPAISITSKRAGYPNTVGKVYFVDGFFSYSCSASVVTADNKDLIFTAGHCVYSETNYAFVTNFIFIPQYDNNTRPYGTWTARSLYAMSNWISYLDLNSDVGIVLLYTLNGQHIQDVVGSQSVGFNYGHSATVYSFGYPVNYVNAQIMTYCTVTKYFSSYSTYRGDAVPCTMNQGCSGGPWFQSFSFSSLSGIQTSVNSFMLNSTPNVLYGPYFDSSVASMYNMAEVSTSTGSSGVNCCTFSAILLLSLLGLLQQCFQNSFLK